MGGAMARPRAADHDLKRGAILTKAASLFAREGYDRTSLAMIAQACGVSKALVYHYYTSKDALLSDIARDHLVDLAAIVERNAGAGVAPDERLRRIVREVLAFYHKHADEQLVVAQAAAMLKG